MNKKTKTLQLLRGEDCDHCHRQDYRPDGLNGAELYCKLSGTHLPKVNTCEEWLPITDDMEEFRRRIAQAMRIPQGYLRAVSKKK
jgi:hypothetical protein